MNYILGLFGPDFFVEQSFSKEKKNNCWACQLFLYSRNFTKMSCCGNFEEAKPFSTHFKYIVLINHFLLQTQAEVVCNIQNLQTS